MLRGRRDLINSKSKYFVGYIALSTRLSGLVDD